MKLDIIKLSMEFADVVVPERLRPYDVRSNITPDQDKGVNFTCFKILVAVAFQKGFEFSCGRPLAGASEIACAAIDYTLEHKLGNNKKKIEFYRQCFKSGAWTCKRMQNNVNTEHNG